MRILYVEDNLNTAQAMKALLGLRGMEVEVAASVTEAVNQLSTAAYDVLISDISLPDGTGHDILSRSPKPIAAIAVSGHVAESDREDALNRGFSEYITKPFRADELIAAIQRVVHAS